MTHESEGISVNSDLESLHPDLAAAIHQDENGRQSVHHPLVVMADYHEVHNRSLNRNLAAATQRVAEAMAQRNWQRYIFIHGRPFRLMALLEIIEMEGWWDQPDEQLWHLLRAVWVDSENISVNLNTWKELWDTPGLDRSVLMNEDELTFYATLPDEIPVWRGAGHDEVADGMSWTINKHQAIWFARRFTFSAETAYLAEGTVRKSDVLAYFSREQEVVVMPENIGNVIVSTVYPSVTSASECDGDKENGVTVAHDAVDCINSGMQTLI